MGVRLHHRAFIAPGEVGCEGAHPHGGLRVNLRLRAWEGLPHTIAGEIGSRGVCSPLPGCNTGQVVSRRPRPLGRWRRALAGVAAPPAEKRVHCGPHVRVYGAAHDNPCGAGCKQLLSAAPKSPLTVRRRDLPEAEMHHCLLGGLQPWVPPNAVR